MQAARERRDFLAVVGAALVAILVLDALVVDVSAARGDDLIYELMARAPGDPHTFPFAYRVGVPSLVHVLPFGQTLSFSLIAWVCSALAAGFAFLLLRHFDVPRWISSGIAIGFAICPALVVVSLRDGRNPDAAAVAIMLVGALFAAQRRERALAVTLLVGAFVRETTLFLIPFAYALWADRLVDWRCLRRVAAIGAPCVAAYVALRLAIPTVGRAQVPGYGGSFVDDRLDIIEKGIDDARLEARRLAIAFGPLWLGLPFAVGRLRFVTAGLVILGLSVVAMTFATDWGRVAFLAAPVVVVAGGWAVRDRQRLAIAMVASLLMLDVAYAVHMDRSGVRVGIEGTHAPTYPIQ